MAPDLTFYVLLVLGQRDDAFTFDVAWARDGKYPNCLPSLSVDDVISPREFRIELPLLWRSAHERAFMWRFAPEPSLADLRAALERPLAGDGMAGDAMRQKAEELVDDAVAKLVEHAVPFFRGVAGKFGTSFPG